MNLTAHDYELLGWLASAAETIGLRHVAQQCRIAGCKGILPDAEYRLLLDGHLSRELLRHLPCTSVDDIR